MSRRWLAMSILLTSMTLFLNTVHKYRQQHICFNHLVLVLTQVVKATFTMSACDSWCLLNYATRFDSFVCCRFLLFNDQGNLKPVVIRRVRSITAKWRRCINTLLKCTQIYWMALLDLIAPIFWPFQRPVDSFLKRKKYLNEHLILRHQIFL